MTFLFKDNWSDSEQCKIVADSPEKAVLIAIKILLDEKNLTVDDICSSLDISLVNADLMTVYYE